MKQYEKEILDAEITDEKQVLLALKKHFRNSVSEIGLKIEALEKRMKVEATQSIIYRLDYQKALKTEIQGILDLLTAQEYETISDYLNRCYQNAYLGTMYSLQKQGIPLIVPIDQEKVINAIVHQSKLSKGLYKDLKYNIDELKKRVSAEVSRGISNNLPYGEIARNINNQTTIELNKAVRIARTEGHRIQGQAQLDASVKAKEKGANVVKQWDASLDGRTRKNHRKLDGQIREIDEEFEVGGKKAITAGQFNDPSEDINCRCRVNQRAKWALDEDELQTLKERAKFFELDKTKDFEDFKKKYLQASDIAPTEEVKFEGITMEEPKRPRRTDFDDDYDGWEKAREKYKQQRELYNQEVDSKVQMYYNKERKIKTQEELYKWLENHNYELSENAKSLDIKAIIDFAETNESLLEKYPIVNGQRQSKFGKYQIGFNPNGSFTASADSEQGFIGFTFGKKAMDYKEYIKEDMLSRASNNETWLVKGNGALKSLYTHEFGHNLYDALSDKIRNEGKSHLDFTKDLIKSCLGKKGMSEYAKTNDWELFSEGFAEYETGSSEFGFAFGEFLKRWLK